MSALFRPIFGGVGCIVCLHRILPEAQHSPMSENRKLELSPEALRDLLTWVRRRDLEAIRIEDVPARLVKPGGRKFVVFTFDDGYRDNLTNALPIFREFAVPLTVYLTTGLINGRSSAWWYSLEAALANRQRLTFNWRNQHHEFSCSTIAEREQAFIAIVKLIRTQGLENRNEIVIAFSRAAGIDPLDRTRELIMTWDDAGRLAADPLVTVGAHTEGHHTLNRLEEVQVRAEYLQAKRDIEQELGGKVEHLSYPFGSRTAVGEREFRIARDCGFATAVTTRSGNLFPEHSKHLHMLPRLVLNGGGDPTVSLLRRLESGWELARANGYRRVVTI